MQVVHSMQQASVACWVVRLRLLLATKACGNCHDLIGRACKSWSRSCLSVFWCRSRWSSLNQTGVIMHSLLALQHGTCADMLHRQTHFSFLWSRVCRQSIPAWTFCYKAPAYITVHLSAIVTPNSVVVVLWHVLYNKTKRLYMAWYNE